MDQISQPVQLTSLVRMNTRGHDDLFVCAAGFEERCLSSSRLMGPYFSTRYSVIFNIEDPHYPQETEENMQKLQATLQRKTIEGIFTVACQRENPVDGIQQMAEILKQCKLNSRGGPYITIDISSFTKIYLLELMHYLVVEQGMPMPRLLHTTQQYLPSRLTRGIEQITTIPHYFGSPSMEKENLLVLFLGFEPERALSIWKQFNPGRTIALITNPPRAGNPEYLDYARQNNEDLLSRQNVELRDVPADDPPGVRTILEGIYEETKDRYNMVIGPFGTKPHVIGVFLFCREHPRVQVIYSYPQMYTRSYLERQPGITMQLPAAE